MHLRELFAKAPDQGWNMVMTRRTTLIFGLLVNALGCEPSVQVEGTGGATICAVIDDQNPCTEDNCENGAATHEPQPEGTPCTVGGTLCDGMGHCVECVTVEDCPETITPCKMRKCTQGQCDFDLAPIGTVSPIDAPGDCSS